VLQTSQRVGSAVGVAAVTAVFFAGLDGNGWADALSRGLRLAAAFAGAGLVVGVLDLGLPARRVGASTEVLRRHRRGARPVLDTLRTACRGGVRRVCVLSPA